MCSAPEISDARERVVTLNNIEVVDELRAAIKLTQDELIEHASATVLEVETIRRQLLELADKTALGLANLAVAIVGMREQSSRWARFRQWFRGNVYDGRPVR